MRSWWRAWPTPRADAQQLTALSQTLNQLVSRFRT
jgi:predicted nucleic acid-binding Zn ribbon protein